MASEQRLGQISPLGSTARLSMCVRGSFPCSKELISMIPAEASAAACSVQLSVRSTRIQHRHVTWCVMLHALNHKFDRKPIAWTLHTCSVFPCNKAFAVHVCGACCMNRDSPCRQKSYFKHSALYPKPGIYCNKPYIYRLTIYCYKVPSILNPHPNPKP